MQLPSVKDVFAKALELTEQGGPEQWTQGAWMSLTPHRAGRGEVLDAIGSNDNDFYGHLLANDRCMCLRTRIMQAAAMFGLDETASRKFEHAIAIIMDRDNINSVSFNDDKNTTFEDVVSLLTALQLSNQ